MDQGYLDNGWVPLPGVGTNVLKYVQLLNTYSHTLKYFGSLQNTSSYSHPQWNPQDRRLIQVILTMVKERKRLDFELIHRAQICVDKIAWCEAK